MESTLKFKFDKKTNLFEFDSNNAKFQLSINNVNANNFIADLDEAIIFKLENKLNLAIYSENDKINFSLSQQDFKITNVELTFIGIIEISSNNNFAIISINENDFIKLQTIDCNIIKISESCLSILFDSPGARIEIFDTLPFSALTALEEGDPPVSILANTEAFVLPGARGPEFSLGFFDSYSSANKHQRGRPIRLGVPVISMVPVYSPNMPQEELTYFNEGRGPLSRKIYFRAVCNQELSDSSVKLLIYLPNGEDTITEPDFVNLNKISSAGQNSVYYGSYTFYVQDYIYSVDGFAYFNIYLDIVQQISIPFEIDETATTYQEFIAAKQQIELF